MDKNLTETPPRRGVGFKRTLVLAAVIAAAALLASQKEADKKVGDSPNPAPTPLPVKS